MKRALCRLLAECLDDVVEWLVDASAWFWRRVNGDAEPKPERLWWMDASEVRKTLERQESGEERTFIVACQVESFGGRAIDRRTDRRYFRGGVH